MDKLNHLENLMKDHRASLPVWEGIVKLLEVKEDKSFQTKLFRRGEYIFREGDEGEVGYVIKDGSVSISKRNGDQKTTLAILHKNDFFGEMALIDGKPRSASAITLEDATVIIIDRNTFRDRLDKYDPLLKCIMKKLVDVIRRLNDALER